MSSHAEKNVHRLSTASLTVSSDAIVYAAIAAAGLLLSWLTRAHASLLPFWTPWDFSWVEFLSAWLVVWWYVRGLLLSPPGARPGIARQISFFV
ncbi:MAG TPA: hypothetical protein VFL51_00405, partial [Pseudolabrys sp.]|nr:hypothetical protein [Pseudolabrys sp.]